MFCSCAHMCVCVCLYTFFWWAGFIEFGVRVARFRPDVYSLCSSVLCCVGSTFRMCLYSRASISHFIFVSFFLVGNTIFVFSANWFEHLCRKQIKSECSNRYVNLIRLINLTHMYYWNGDMCLCATHTTYSYSYTAYARTHEYSVTAPRYFVTKFSHFSAV